MSHSFVAVQWGKNERGVSAPTRHVIANNGTCPEFLKSIEWYAEITDSLELSWTCTTTNRSESFDGKYAGLAVPRELMVQWLEQLLFVQTRFGGIDRIDTILACNRDEFRLVAARKVIGATAAYELDNDKQWVLYTGLHATDYDPADDIVEQEATSEVA